MKKFTSILLAVAMVAAMTVIMMIPPILVYMISQSNVMQAMTSAGIKE